MGGEQLAGQRQLVDRRRSRTSTIGRSPEMPCRQRPGWPCRFAARTGGVGPQGGAGEDDVRRPAAGTGGRPRATSSGAGARPGCGPRPARRPGRRRAVSRYWSASASASSRVSATAVVKATTADVARLEPDPAAEAEDRVEHRRRSSPRGSRRGRAPPGRPASGRGRGTGRGRSRTATSPGGRRRRRPRRGRPRSAAARATAGRRRQSRASGRGEPLGLEEQLAERRVRQVGAAGGPGRPRRSWSAPARGARCRGWSA